MSIGDVLRRSPLYRPAAWTLGQIDFIRWNGQPPFPHRAKTQTVAAYAETFKPVYFVETGTCLGDMVEAQRRRFKHVWSIELEPTLAARSRRRFLDRPNVTIIEGDSASKLPEILSRLDAPALFWLDAHYSGGVTARGDVDTPIETELRLVLAHDARHVILIDDARCFDGTNDYPTIAGVKRLVGTLRPNHTVIVHQDIIRIHEPR